jgi:hypothetical protein
VQKQTNLDVSIFFTIPAFPYVAQATLSGDIDGFLGNFHGKVGQVSKIRSASSELGRLERSSLTHRRPYSAGAPIQRHSFQPAISMSISY